MTTLMKHGGEANVFSPLPSLFSDSFLRNWFNWDTDETPQMGTLPAVNIIETEDAFELTVAAPGMAKNDFKVSIENNRLVISGTRKNEQEKGNNQSWLRREFNYTSFTRSFTLAEKWVNPDSIKARYTDGLLHITIPKPAEAKNKPERVIPIA